MITRMKQLRRVAALMLFTGLLGVAVDSTSGSKAQVNALSPQELRGRRIYQAGESVSGKPITATISDLDVPGASMSCAGCHGSSGQGTTEGGISSGNVTWSYLTNPAGHVHPTGRKHKAFDELLISRATSECVDPDGHKLLSAMPCYKMSAQDMADLIAYLKRVEADPQPGVTETTITIGSIIPTTGPLTEMGEAMQGVLTGYFAEINSQGGVYNRKFVLAIVEVGGDQASENLKSTMQSNQIFALVGGVAAGLDDQVVALAQSEQLPVIGPATLLPRSASNDYVFYLSPGIDDQARALVSFAAQKPELRKSKLSLVASKQEVLAGVANIENHARSLNWSLVRHDYERSTFNASQLIESLKADKSDTLFIIGSKEEAAAILKEAAAANWAPDVLILGVVGGGVVSSMPASFQGKVFASFPTVPTDISPAGIAEFRALQEKYKLTNRHVASQLSALAAAKVFVETLKQSGKDLTRIKLIHALQQVSNFDTGVSRPVTFGPKERVGSRGSYIVGVDAEKKEFMPTPIWVRSN